jgi:hypothetical protein
MVGNPANFDPPVTLTAEHNLDDFQSGEPTLDDWLKQRALANMQNAASRTYVVCQSGSSKVFAYYALSMGRFSTATSSAPCAGTCRRRFQR